MTTIREKIRRIFCPVATAIEDDLKNITQKTITPCGLCLWWHAIDVDREIGECRIYPKTIEKRSTDFCSFGHRK
ncbi:MAG: hypothetical protein JW885_02675 [Deltaproteobacteria bacterium]|nr:hypothetical protein [Candidatus Zymogenaceae bacterium]